MTILNEMKMKFVLFKSRTLCIIYHTILVRLCVHKRWNLLRIKTCSDWADHQSVSTWLIEGVNCIKIAVVSNIILNCDFNCYVPFSFSNKADFGCLAVVKTG